MNYDIEPPTGAFFYSQQFQAQETYNTHILTFDNLREKASDAFFSIMQQNILFKVFLRSQVRKDRLASDF